MFYPLLLRDIIEICFYSSCIYIFCLWLKADRTKNILIYFFAYCVSAVCAWSLQLPTLTPFLSAYAPIALLLFIVLHEKTLQRNFITLCAITPPHPQHEDWIDTLLSSSLSSINANKSITVIIEHKHALDDFLNTSFFINADMGKGIVDILLASSSYDQHKMIWIHSSGRIRGINATWCVNREKREDALFYTLQTDAIILSANPINRTFNIISNGKEISHLSAQQLRILIKKQLAVTTTPVQKGAYRDKVHTEKSISQ